MHRFLRARKFDVPKAKAMLLSAEQWRKDENVDELVRCVFVFVMTHTFAVLNLSTSPFILPQNI